MVEDFEQVEMDCADLGLGIEGGASIDVVFSEAAHEVLILGRPIDGVQRHFLRDGRHGCLVVATSASRFGLVVVERSRTRR